MTNLKSNSRHFSAVQKNPCKNNKKKGRKKQVLHFMFGSQEVLGECEHACASLWELRPEALTER